MLKVYFSLGASRRPTTWLHHALTGLLLLLLATSAAQAMSPQAQIESISPPGAG